MEIRKITSLTAFVSFFPTLLTSVILYIAPQGRISNWSEWRLWGLSKTEWGNLHINLGILFLLSLFLHIYYNWKPILNYLKNKAKKITVFTKSFNISLTISCVFALGTYFMIPPFSTIIDISENIKNAAATKYGEPPFGHAEEAPFDSLIKKTGLDFEISLAKLESAGIKLDSPKQIFLDIAKKNNMTPQQVFDIINIKPVAGEKKIMPETPPPGTGSKSLEQLCEEYQIDCEKIKMELFSKGIKIDSKMSLKSIASENNKTSVELYDAIKDAAGKK